MVHTFNERRQRRQPHLKHLMYTVHAFNERWQPYLKHLMYTVDTFNKRRQRQQPHLKHLMYTVHTLNERWQPHLKHLMYTVDTFNKRRQRRQPHLKHLMYTVHTLNERRQWQRQWLDVRVVGGRLHLRDVAVGRGSAVDELQLEPAWAVLGAERAEDAGEGVAELLAHRAVQHEVHRVVDERHDVEQVAQRVVHCVLEAPDEDVHQRQQPLRQLRHHEQNHHRQQHLRRAVVLPMLVRLGLPALGLEQQAPAVRLVHGVDQQDGQRHEHGARDQLDEDRLDPVVDLPEHPGHICVRPQCRFVQVDVVRVVGGGVVGGVDEAHVHAHVQHARLETDSLEAVYDYVRYAQQQHRQVHEKNGDARSVQVAVHRAFGWHADVDVAEDGQGDGQPYGHRVTYDAEAGVEHEKADPAEALGGEGGEGGNLEDVEVDREGQVGQHGEEVGHGQPHEDGVGRRDHVLPGQHQDVGHVGDEAEHAHGGAEVAVVVGIVGGELAQPVCRGPADDALDVADVATVGVARGHDEGRGHVQGRHDGRGGAGRKCHLEQVVGRVEVRVHHSHGGVSSLDEVATRSEKHNVILDSV